MLQLFVFQVKTYIGSMDFQYSSELFTTENVLPCTDEVILDLVHNCLKQLHLFALHFEILGYVICCKNLGLKVLLVYVEK